MTRFRTNFEIQFLGLFGPRDNMATPRMLQVGLSKKSRFAQIGDNSNLFDYTYIENVAHSHILAADKLTTGSSIGGQVRKYPNRNFY